FPTGYGFYLQNSQGGAYTGVDVFTGGGFYQGTVGDSVVVYGKLQEFNNQTEIRSFSSSTSAFTPPFPIVRMVSGGNPLPPFHVATIPGEVRELPNGVTNEQWDGALVKYRNKLRVVRAGSPNSGLGTFNMKVVDNGCTVAPCDTIFIDGATLSYIGV